jgi:hypothetical protein
MIIDKKRDRESGALTYAVCADIRETGRKEPSAIVVFDKLATAALAIKYLRGDRMTWEDTDAAKEAIAKAEKLEEIPERGAAF